ncbi:SRPBCC family protein [Sphingomonas asaccharolytica]|uniref:SRPBCC family protein n=1 Tax=Sphingomonas asaccharolytica TaxID=40681 RepID=UPI00082B2624|nr:SRPBCC domain-containing protein [Sphingomonas asaccharolytica]
MVASDIRARVKLSIDADTQSVFDAWTDPALMERWLFKSPDNKLSARADPRVGGAYSITEQAAGRVITHDGIYTIVDPPTRLAFSLVVPQHFAGVAHIDIQIRQVGSGSRLDFMARGAGPDDAQQIWEGMLSIS